jgi:alpha-1,2-mannosyltransferase
VLERRDLTAVAWVAIGVSAAMCWHYLVLAREAYLLDLDVYREAAQVAWAGGDLYGLRFTFVSLPYLYPPFGILFLTPIAFLSDVSAQVVWTLITLMAVIGYAAVCVQNFAAQRFHTPTVYAVTIAFTLAMEPTESGINFGQVNILLAVFLVLDLSRRTGWIPQGVLTGIAAAVKLTPLLLAVYYLVTRQVRAALWTVGTFFACSAVAAVVFPKASWVYWTGTFLESDRVGVAYISNQSLNGLLQRMLGDTQAARFGWLVLATAVAVAVMAVAHHLFDTYPHLTDALVLAAILLISPISWTAHWILILPLLLVAALPDRPVPLLQGLAAVLGLALLYGVVRPSQTAQILADPENDQLFFGNTFTWLTLLVAVGCVLWYWSRIGEDVPAAACSAPAQRDQRRPR